MKFYKPFSQSNLSTKNQDNAEEISLLINEKKSLTKQIPIWRFVLPLTLQLALILSVPAQAIYTHITGRTVILQTAPIDPYDFLRGYYQVLSYDISRKDNLSKLSGWHQFKLETSGRFSSNNQTNIYVILAAPTKIENSEIPRVWQPVAVSGKMPENLPDNQIAIQGKFDGWRVKYGLETYFMPEDRREKINQDIQEVQDSVNLEEDIPFVVEAKVNSQGKAVPVSLWVRERNYRF
mgnify:FL=1